MKPTTDFLCEIAARAMTLDERLAALPPPKRPAAGRLDAPEPGPVDLWRRTVAGGDPRAFRRRLSWDGLRESAVGRAVSAPVRVSPSDLPRWAAAIAGGLDRSREVLDSVRRGRPLPELERASRADEPCFGEVLVPFLRHARAELARAAGSDFSILAPPARAALEGALLSRLAWQAGRVLYQEFDRFRRQRFFLPHPASEVGAAPPGRRLYREFAGAMLSGGLNDLFVEYSALARQIGTAVDGWVDAGAELVARVARDGVELRRRFGAEGKVVALSGSLSDRHAGGRSVLALKFRSGARLIYKPRTIALEAAWNAFLGSLARRAPALRLPVPRWLERSGYGYVEQLFPGSLSGPREAAEYFRRAGHCLGLSWLLGANDFHWENVLATAAGPIVIDAESVLQPEPPRRPAGGGRERAEERAVRRWAGSFLRAGLLTLPQLDASGMPVDLGGLRGTGGHVAAAAGRRILARNTDAMEIVTAVETAAAARNLPTLAGRRLLPDEYREACLDGFEAVLNRFARRGRRVAAPRGWLEAFAGRPTRYLLRPSGVYASLLDVLSAPEFLRMGIERSFALDAINRVFVARPRRPAVWPLVAQERRALEDGDLPHFSVGVDKTTWRAGEGEARGVFGLSGLAAARRRLRRLTPREVARQRELLAGCLANGRRDARESGLPAEPLTGDLVALAEDVGDAILRVRAHGARASRFSLYDGALGVALFLAALSASSGKDRFRKGAMELLRAVERALGRGRGAALLAEGIGAAQGLGSLMYGLVAIEEFLPGQPVLDLARRAAGLLTVRAAARWGCDLQAGSAGAILGLLSVFEAAADERALGTAVALGESLRRSRRDFGGRRWGWPSEAGPCLAGMAHGSSGIVLALTRLGRTANRPRFTEAARRGDRYEDSLFDAGRENWPVLVRHDGETGRVFRTAWCHGAPGVVLSLVARGETKEPGLLARVERGLRGVRRAGVLATDQACCGNVAIIEAFLAAGEAFGRTDWIAEARGRAAVVVHAAMERRSFRVARERGDASGLSFFRGLSGIGYTLLRVARPGTLPSVLAFEAPKRRPRAGFVDSPEAGC